ncbi:hypothetical protein BDA96_02G099200 [Sorghum bicolor]|uniref:Uncharacterized protein n=1 Tax=Sorghum bicolor TaxID=4558 RepID=A0A921RLE0_SORBI|nr:hypothetical protein BDA96_02G099200 [Sorghum bicolor]
MLDAALVPAAALDAALDAALAAAPSHSNEASTVPSVMTFTLLCLTTSAGSGPMLSGLWPQEISG